MKHIKNIKVLFSDVDGTLTNGQLFYNIDGEVTKVFHVKDGAGIKLWMAAGFKFGVITARSSRIVINRMNELGVSEIMMNAFDKKAIMDFWLAKHQLAWENLAYIGDDINDLPVMQLAGISAAPHDAITSVYDTAMYRCRTAGGMGAVREFIDFLLETGSAS